MHPAKAYDSQRSRPRAEGFLPKMPNLSLSCLKIKTSLTSREDKGVRELIPHYWPYPHPNPSQVIFRSPPRSGTPMRATK